MLLIHWCRWTKWLRCRWKDYSPKRASLLMTALITFSRGAGVSNWMNTMPRSLHFHLVVVTWVQLIEVAMASVLIAIHRNIFMPSFSESCPY